MDQRRDPNLVRGEVTKHRDYFDLHVAYQIPMAPPKPKAALRSSSTVQSLWKAYNEQTADRLKFIDAFLVFIMLSGALQFLYCILVTNFPFNAFLAGYVTAQITRISRVLTVLLQIRQHDRSIRFDCVTSLTSQS